MNGQQRASAPAKDYSAINFVKKVQLLANYKVKSANKTYKRILFTRPFSNTYMGYLDGEFFGFTVPEGSDTKYWLMDVDEALDYYFKKTWFHNSSLEYDIFNSKPEYKPYINALKYRLDNIDNGNKTNK